jgi:hypothetical protein
VSATPLAKETFTSAQPDATLASTAGVPVQAVTALRAGVPSWQLERPGVIDALAKATGADAALIRSNMRRAKAIATGLRAHGSTGPATFPGQTYPSLRS